MDYPSTPMADSPLRLVVRDLQAQAFLIRCYLVGTIIGYSHQGAEWVYYWAWTDKDNTAPRPASGLVIEPEVREFRIPLQAANVADGTSAFAGKGDVSENDLIAWNNHLYVINQPWTMDFYEAIFNMTGTSTHVRRSGP
jgi:hypothetical protein